MSEEVLNEKQTSEVGGEIIKIEFKNFYDDAQTKVKNHHIYFVKADFAKQHPEYAKYPSPASNIDSATVFATRLLFGPADLPAH